MYTVVTVMFITVHEYNGYKRSNFDHDNILSSWTLIL